MAIKVNTAAYGKSWLFTPASMITTNTINDISNCHTAWQH
jgi:hypothetical protein